MHTPEISEFVFVYGTLKQGYGNNRLLAPCEFIGEHRTELNFHVYDCGFPVAFPEQIGAPVLGEVYRLPPEDELKKRVVASLDRLEGEGYMYKRWRTRVIKLDNSVVCTPFMYMGVPENWTDRHRLRLIKPDEHGLIVWGRHKG